MRFPIVMLIKSGAGYERVNCTYKNGGVYAPDSEIPLPTARGRAALQGRESRFELVTAFSRRGND